MDEEKNNGVEKSGEQEPDKKKKGLALMLYDLKERKLVPLKIVCFLSYAAYGVLLPYTSIHMKSLGMSVEETGAVYGIASVVGVLVPFCIGMVADKIGNFKVLLSALHGVATISALLFLLIPTGRLSIEYPVNMSLAVDCNQSHNLLMLTDFDSNPCDLKLGKDSNLVNVSVIFDECGYVCSDNRSNFKPDNWSLDISCSPNFNGDEICVVNRKTGSEPTANFTMGLSVSSENSTNFIVQFMIMEDGQILNNFQCGSYGQDNSFLHHDQLCRLHCLVRANRSDLCSNKAHTQEFNPKLTFGVYVLLRLFFESMISGAGTLFEGASLALVEEVGGDFGMQRVFGFIGIAIFSPISGVLIDYSSSDGNSQNYKPVFYLFAVLYGFAAIGMLTIDLDFKPPTKNLFKDMKSVFKNIELNVLFIITFISGTISGATGNFLFIFLEEIGCSKSIMGLALMVSCFSTIPLLILSDMMFRKFGQPNVIVLSFAIFAARLTGYSYTTDPNMCIFYEFMEAFCGALAMTAIVTYSVKLGTKSTLASIQGLIGAIYFGLGIGVIGSFVGSFIIQAYGQRMTFRILAIIASITGFTYMLFNIFYIRPKNNRNKNHDLKVETEKSP